MMITFNFLAMEDKYNTEEINDWTFTRTNYILFCVGILTIFLGYILMYTGKVTSYQSITIAPIFLIIGYCILIPVSILYKK